MGDGIVRHNKFEQRMSALGQKRTSIEALFLRNEAAVGGCRQRAAGSSCRAF